MKKPRRIPAVLSVQEVERFLNSFTNLKHKAIFMLIYSAGLHVGELLNLKIGDIDSDRMQIRITACGLTGARIDFELATNER